MEKVLCENDIGLEKTQYCSLDGTTSVLGNNNGVQRQIQNHATQAIYINCRSHGVALMMLLGLQKTFHFSSKNHYTLKEMQLADGMKALNIIKTSVTRWLSYGAACKRCCKRYTVVVDVLDDIISKNPKPELIGYQSQLLNSKTLLEIAFLEDKLPITHIHLFFRQKKKILELLEER